MTRAETSWTISKWLTTKRGLKLSSTKSNILYFTLSYASRMKEYSEMKECTFDPKINKSMPASVHQEKLGKSVAGMEAFLEQRDRAKRLQQDKKKREEKVFHIENKYNATKHLTYTQPEPFNISQVSSRVIYSLVLLRYEIQQYMKGIRDEEMRREIQEREAKTYTFKPETNET